MNELRPHARHHSNGGGVQHIVVSGASNCSSGLNMRVEWIDGRDLLWLVEELLTGLGGLVSMKLSGSLLRNCVRKAARIGNASVVLALLEAAGRAGPAILSEARQDLKSSVTKFLAQLTKEAAERLRVEELLGERRRVWRGKGMAEGMRGKLAWETFRFDTVRQAILDGGRAWKFQDPKLVQKEVERFLLQSGKAAAVGFLKAAERGRSASKILCAVGPDKYVHLHRNRTRSS